MEAGIIFLNKKNPTYRMVLLIFTVLTNVLTGVVTILIAEILSKYFGIK